MEVESWHIQGDSFHFGRQGLGQEVTAVTMPSDSLFAALVSSLAQLRGANAVEAFMAPFLAGKPPFALSSTFPSAGQVRFFPAPLQAVNTHLMGRDAPRIKEIKKVRFVSEGLFHRFLTGSSPAELYNRALSLQNGQTLVSQEEVQHLPAAIRRFQEPIWEVERRPRVTIGRRSSNSTIFFTGRVIFQADCGLWFGLRWLKNDQELKTLVKDLLAELGTSGLGAERSIGFGGCQISQSENLQLVAEVGTPWLSLSRYLPRSDELDSLHDPSAAYRLETVGGWLDSPARRGQRRRPVNLLATGSIFGKLPREVPGQIVDVRPSYAADSDPVGHPVYRYGMALAASLTGDSP